MHLVEEKWDEILLTVKREHELTDISFNTWLKPLQIFSIQNNRIYILVSGEQMGLTYINRKYYLPLKVAVAEVTGTEYEIEFVLPEQAKKLKTPHPRRRATTEEAERSNLNPNYTFDTFVVGNNNRFAHSAALAVAESPGEVYNPLFIYGGVGLGKTHLMHSIAHYILSYNPDYKIIYTTTETFSNELISAIKNKTQEAFKDKYRNIDMLLIDDIQFIAGKDSTMEEFFHTFNTLYENKKQIVISSDKPPKDIVGVEDRLISRFKVGLTVDVQPPDYETRVAILVKRAELEHINIEVDALHYVADHISSNIRELEGALRQIYNFSRLKHADRIDTDLAREALKDIIAPDEARPITPEVIIETVTEHYNYKVTKDDILGKNRSRDISYPRQICMYLCEKYTGLSLAAIGAALGNKDHTTVLHGIKKIKTDLEKDEQLRSTIDIITKKLNPPK